MSEVTRSEFDALAARVAKIESGAAPSAPQSTGLTYVEGFHGPRADGAVRCEAYDRDVYLPNKATIDAAGSQYGSHNLGPWLYLPIQLLPAALLVNLGAEGIIRHQLNSSAAGFRNGSAYTYQVNGKNWDGSPRYEQDAIVNDAAAFHVADAGTIAQLVSSGKARVRDHNKQGSGNPLDPNFVPG